MKKFVWALCTLFVFMVACTGRYDAENEREEVPFENQETELQDTLAQNEVAEVLPARADELFDDFMFNYSKDSMVQMRRTEFPLPYYKDGQKHTVARADWKKQTMFRDMAYYSVLYDQASDMEIGKDTAVMRVRMEYLDLEKKEAKRYHFVRNDRGFWILYKIVEEKFNQQLDPTDFLGFYEKFATDSVYQREHVAEHLNFITFDPDDEFSTVECDITVDQWFAFRPELPMYELTQVNYGQKTTGNKSMVVNFRSDTNGFNNILTFHHTGKGWMLTSFEDTSE